MEARIVSLADVYDTLRRPRLYKPARSHTEAVRQILFGAIIVVVAAAYTRVTGEA